MEPNKIGLYLHNRIKKYRNKSLFILQTKVTDSLTITQLINDSIAYLVL